MSIEPGLYHHYKGNDYVVDVVGRHTETEELLVVYYAAKDADKPKEKRKIWIRPLSMFMEVALFNGDEAVPRFKRIDGK